MSTSDAKNDTSGRRIARVRRKLHSTDELSDCWLATDASVCVSPHYGEAYS